MTTTNSHNLIELAERCEKATGRSLYLEAEIAETLGWTNTRVKDHRAALGIRPRHMNPLGKAMLEWVPAYTGSIDAAMALVTGYGVLISLSGIKGDGLPQCIVGDCETSALFEAVAPTMPLALCAAALRARAAQ